MRFGIRIWLIVMLANIMTMAQRKHVLLVNIAQEKERLTKEQLDVSKHVQMVVKPSKVKQKAFMHVAKLLSQVTSNSNMVPLCGIVDTLRESVITRNIVMIARRLH